MMALSAMQKFAAVRGLALALGIVLLAGCATPNKPVSYDYTAFRESRPSSILVLPPLNKTPEVRAPYSMLSQVTRPLAESGYYVLPVALVDEMLRENGVTQPTDAHQLPSARLREIFGADAVLYITMTQYGTRFQIFDSVTTVAATAVLKDLRTDAVLWTGSAMASSAEQQQQQQGGLAGALLTAVVKQVVGTVTDQGHTMAGLTSQRLLGAGRPAGLLHGPRSPLHTTR